MNCVLFLALIIKEKSRRVVKLVSVAFLFFLYTYLYKLLFVGSFFSHSLFTVSFFCHALIYNKWIRTHCYFFSVDVVQFSHRFLVLFIVLLELSVFSRFFWAEIHIYCIMPQLFSFYSLQLYFLLFTFFLYVF